jgi:mycothiol synthase
MTGRHVTVGTLGAAQVGEVLALAEAARAADRVAPLSEHVLLHLRYDRVAQGPDAGGQGAAPGRDLVLAVDGEVVGYAYLEPPATEQPDGPADLTGELVVRPDRRGRGFGLALVRELTAEADGHHVRVWAHGDLPSAAGLATAAGFERVRALWQMRRSLRDPPGEPRFAPGIELRTFVPGRDEVEWLRVNGRAFASHPEQGRWTRHDLDMREREPWFDPAGFFIADSGGAIAGFHWTKVHAGGIGEIYVLGVDPDAQGSGLGRALALAGLRYLRERGVDQAMLYVDEDNVPAIRMYTALGFARATTDVMYRGAGTARAPQRRGDTA